MSYKTEVDGVKVESDFAASDKEIKKYLAYMATKHNKKISDIEKAALKAMPGNNVDVDVVFREQKFERIRRITG